MSEEEKKEVIAFLLLLTAGENTEELLKDLRTSSEFKQIVEAYIIYGEFDIILKVKVNNLPELTELVMKLRRREGIKKTSTLITLAN